MYRNWFIHVLALLLLIAMFLMKLLHDCRYSFDELNRVDPIKMQWKWWFDIIYYFDIPSKKVQLPDPGTQMVETS